MTGRRISASVLYWASAAWRHFQVLAILAVAAAFAIALLSRRQLEPAGFVQAAIVLFVAATLILMVGLIRRRSARAAVSAVNVLTSGESTNAPARCGSPETLSWLCDALNERYTYWAAEGVVLSVNDEVLDVYCVVPFSGAARLRHVDLSQLINAVVVGRNVEFSVGRTELRFELNRDSVLTKAIQERLL